MAICASRTISDKGYMIKPCRRLYFVWVLEKARGRVLCGRIRAGAKQGDKEVKKVSTGVLLKS